MSATLPYMVSYGLVPKILGRIEEAARPSRFTQDFLATKLGFSGGSAMAAIPLLKRLGFISGDGAPTNLYDMFRNPDTRGAAMAAALREGYKDLYAGNEYAHDLPRDKLQVLIKQITGLAKDSRVIALTASTFDNLKKFADFDGTISTKQLEPDTEPRSIDGMKHHLPTRSPRVAGEEQVDLRLSYTINLNLPETTDPEVFNAIFKSLKENLLKG